MADQEVKIRITTDSSGAVVGFSKLDASMKKTEAASVSISAKLKANWLGLSAAVAAASIAASKAWDMMDQAAAYEERIGAIAALGAQYGMTGTQIVDSMTSASRGLLSLTDASDMAAKSLNMSLSPAQMIEFTEVAERLSDAVGMSIPDAYDRMVTAAAKGRVNSLAEMGLVVDLDAAYKNYAESLGRSADSLSNMEKQSVRLNAVLAAGKSRVEMLGPATDSTADKMDRMRAAVSNLTLSMGQVLIRVVSGAVGAFQWLAAGVLTATSVFPRLLQYVSLANAKLYEWTGQTDRMKAARLEAQSLGQTADDMLGAAGELTGKAADNFSIMTASTAELAQASRKSLSSVTADVEKVKGKTESMDKAWQDLCATLEGKIAVHGLDDLSKQLVLNQQEADALKRRIEEMQSKGLSKDKAAQAFSLVDRAQLNADMDAIATMEKKAEETYQADVDAREKAEKEKRDLQEKTAAERLTAERDIYTDLIGYEDSYYASTVTLIEKQAARYRELQIDEVAITVWAEEEKRKARLKMARSGSGGSFSEGWSEGLKTWGKDVNNMFVQGEQMAKTTASSMSDSFSSLFFDVIHGECKDFSSYFKSFTDTLLKMFCDMLADMVAKWILETAKMTFTDSKSGTSLISSGISLVSGFLGGTTTSGTPDLGDMPGGHGALTFHSGGIVGESWAPTRQVPAYAFAGAARYHNGLASDEFPAILQRGETVTPRGKSAGNSITVNVPVSADVGGKKMIADLRAGIESTVVRIIKRHS